MMAASLRPSRRAAVSIRCLSSFGRYRVVFTIPNLPYIYHTSGPGVSLVAECEAAPLAPAVRRELLQLHDVCCARGDRKTFAKLRVDLRRHLAPETDRQVRDHLGVRALVRRVLRISLGERPRQLDERIRGLRREPHDLRPAAHRGQREFEWREPCEQLGQSIVAIAEGEEQRDMRRNAGLVRVVVPRAQGADDRLGLGDDDHQRRAHRPKRRDYRSGVTTQAASLDRQWLLRALLVLQAPRAVFSALRDEADDAAQARQEPVLALLWLAGIAGVLATSVARTLLDDPTRDGLTVAVWAFLGGGFYGALAFWLC